jgi:hypothetical protein
VGWLSNRLPAPVAGVWLTNDVPARRGLAVVVAQKRALLALYQALRTAITDAVQTVPGTDPDRASYQIAVETAQDLVTGARNLTGPDGNLAGDIGRAVLANLHGPCQPSS